MKARTVLMIAAPFLAAAFLVSLGGVFAIVAGRMGYGLRGVSYATTQEIKVNGRTLKIEMVTTTEAMAQGLGDRDSMPKDAGMLFIFAEEGTYPFWMRHMRFPLDIIWLRGGTVVDVAHNVPPPKLVLDVPVTHIPKGTADQVLELNAGMAGVYGLTEGAVVDSLAAFR